VKIPGLGASSKPLTISSANTSTELQPVTPYCIFAELVSETVFEIRQLLVGDILLSP